MRTIILKVCDRTYAAIQQLTPSDLIISHKGNRLVKGLVSLKLKTSPVKGEYDTEKDETRRVWVARENIDLVADLVRREEKKLNNGGTPQQFEAAISEKLEKPTVTGL